jgi:hypothetical protein
LTTALVYAPLAGKAAAVCTRSSNTVGATVTYKVSSMTPPPWDYSRAIDNVINLPLYGNFVWLYSTDANSLGYFIFFCHLKNETTLQSLAPDQLVTMSTPIGVMGDTGNAAGTPQLHVEIHYPAGTSFTCNHCTPNKSVTSIDPEASLIRATRRVAETRIALHLSAVFEGDCVSSHPSIPNPHERDRVLALRVRRGPGVRHSRESGNPLLRGGGPWAEALLLICGVRVC